MRYENNNRNPFVLCIEKHFTFFLILQVSIVPANIEVGSVQSKIISGLVAPVIRLNTISQAFNVAQMRGTRIVNICFFVR